jgi:hypothetical protein
VIAGCERLRTDCHDFIHYTFRVGNFGVCNYYHPLSQAQDGWYSTAANPGENAVFHNPIETTINSQRCHDEDMDGNSINDCSLMCNPEAGAAWQEAAAFIPTTCIAPDIGPFDRKVCRLVGS